ncbi:MAG TPA: SNF2-related protein [Tepidisphaeraceae bacterium]
MAGKLGQIGALASFDLVAGDRFELRVGGVADGVVRLELPRSFVGLGDQPQIVEDAAKRLVKATLSDDGSALMIEPSPKGGLLEGSVEAVWLEYVSANRYRLVVKRGSPPVENEIIGGPVRDGLAWPMDAEDARLVSQPPKCRNLIEFQLGLQAARLATQPGFDQLISLPMVHEMEVLEHQTRTAVTVLRRMRGRAMLCDEVGLGKTVEAGLILSELLMRGLARSVLILTPPSLMAQWQGEMRRKFGIELTSHDEPGFRDAGAAAWGKFDRVIASIHTAKREPHRGAILGRKWDIVIVDEAHHLRNRTTEIWKFASEIEKQFILLLTATPVQNNLEELFNLVTLLEPGLLSTRKDFCRRFVAKGDKMTPTNVGDLHALLAEVMVRNKRNNVGLEFTRRFARTELVSLDDGERALYDAVAELVREGLKKEKKSTDLNRMTLLTLQMALGSSAAAAAGVLGNLVDKPIQPAEQKKKLKDLLSRTGDLRAGGAKAARLLRLLEEFPDKLVVFTQFRATQEMLRGVISNAGIEVAMFHGGLSRMEKEAAIGQFRESARVLVCTESGSEGRNLQFAHGLCNFDLPWNPMRIEQRVGRLSRIGQKHDVHVFNLVAGNTIEAAVLHLLEAKLNMFELVIGEVDMILGNLDDEKEFEDLIADEWAASSGADEFASRMEVLGNRLLAAKAAYFRQQAQDEKIFGSRFAPEG